MFFSTKNNNNNKNTVKKYDLLISVDEQRNLNNWQQCKYEVNQTKIIVRPNRAQSIHRSDT